MFATIDQPGDRQIVMRLEDSKGLSHVVRLLPDGEYGEGPLRSRERLRTRTVPTTSDLQAIGRAVLQSRVRPAPRWQEQATSRLKRSPMFPFLETTLAGEPVLEVLDQKRSDQAILIDAQVVSVQVLRFHFDSRTGHATLETVAGTDVRKQ